LTFYVVLVGLVVTTLIAIVVNQLTKPEGRIDKRLFAILGALLVIGAIVIAWDRSLTAEQQSDATTTPTSTQPTPLSASSAPSSTESATSIATSETSTIDSPTPGNVGRTYIEEMRYTQTADPYDTRANARINGQVYPHSQGAKFCPNSERNWEADLGRAYSEFHATIGLDDDSPSDAIVRYELIADGRIIFSRDMPFGEAFAVNAPVKDVLRIQMVTTLLTPTCTGATAHWGEAFVHRT
jgi:hypothetical protein